MPPFPYSLVNLARGGKPVRSATSFLLTRSQESTATELLAQLSNPTDILSVLLIIGGDIVQKALAQMTGHTLAPICFSFGWVSYSFLSMVTLLGDGRLMPPPDYPCKVVNIASGYFRQNKNWVVGRLLRGNEAFMAKKHHGKWGGNALRISIYRSSPLVPKDGFLRILHLLFTLVQFGMTSIPWIMYGDWTTFLIIGFGTLMAIITGILPQWRIEKFPARSVT